MKGTAVFGNSGSNGMMMSRDYRLLDSKLFKAFMAAAETGNFTLAAQRVHMTQSGVSQHISKLERQIGMPLFSRIGKRAFLTPTGTKLSRYIEDYASSTAAFLDGLREEGGAVSGSIHIALPATCVTSPHLAEVLRKKAENPDLFLNVMVGNSEDVTRMLLRGELDFGIVTERIPHGELEFEHFCREEYVVVADRPKTLASITAENAKSQLYVLYPEAHHYLRVWFKDRFGQTIGPDEISNIAFSASINSIEGAIRMVATGLGIGVFPRHAVLSALEEKRVFEHGRGWKPLFNDTYFAFRCRGHYSRAVREVLGWFKAVPSAIADE